MPSSPSAPGGRPPPGNMRLQELLQDDADFTYDRLIQLDSAIPRKGLPYKSLQLFERVRWRHKSKRVAEDDSGECSICLDEYEHDDWIKVLPCGGKHFFHECCVIKWFKEQTKCPLCRHDCSKPAIK